MNLKINKLCKNFSIGVLMMWAANISAATLSVSPNSQTVSPSGTVSIDIVVSGLGNFSPLSLSAFDIDISYDASILTFQNATFGDPILGDQLDLFGLGSAAFVTPSSGSVNLLEISFDTAFDLDTLQAGSFVLATLYYTAIAPGTSAIGIFVNDLSDSLGNSFVASSVVDGSVTVSAVPVPAAVWLLSSGLIALVAFSKRKAI